MANYLVKLVKSKHSFDEGKDLKNASATRLFFLLRKGWGTKGHEHPLHERPLLENQTWNTQALGHSVFYIYKLQNNMTEKFQSKSDQ